LDTTQLGQLRSDTALGSHPRWRHPLVLDATGDLAEAAAPEASAAAQLRCARTWKEVARVSTSLAAQLRQFRCVCVGQVARASLSLAAKHRQLGQLRGACADQDSLLTGAASHHCRAQAATSFLALDDLTQLLGIVGRAALGRHGLGGSRFSTASAHGGGHRRRRRCAATQDPCGGTLSSTLLRPSALAPEPQGQRRHR